MHSLGTSMDKVGKKRIGWPITEMQLWRGRRREGKYCSCEVVSCRQCDKAYGKGLERQEYNCFGWNFEVVLLFSWKLSGGFAFQSVSSCATQYVTYSYKPSIPSRSVAKPDEHRIHEDDQIYFLPDHISLASWGMQFVYTVLCSLNSTEF